MKEILDETIEKISDTKLETSRQKIINGFVKNNIPGQSNIKLAIPSHRTREWISFEEFKKLIKKGKTLQELRLIYSKHLIAFYSFLSQGKATLTKEQFIEEYEKGISLNEIAKSYNIPREHITYLREYYGIKRKGATYQKRLQNEVPLSQEAKDVIIGSLLGDGHITKWGYFSEKHSEKQVEYLEWKGEILKDIMTNKSYSIYSSIDKRSRTQIESFTLRTITHSFIYEIRENFYQKRGEKWVKTIPKNIKDLLNEKILAIWFMDDGNTDWGYRNGTKEYPNSKPQCKICSESFSLEENIFIGEILKEKYGLITNIRFKNPSLNEQPYLRFDCDSSLKLIEIIKKFITRDLLYKVDEQEYLKHQLFYFNKDIIKKIFITKHKISITKIIINEKK